MGLFATFVVDREFDARFFFSSDFFVCFITVKSENECLAKRVVNLLDFDLGRVPFAEKKECVRRLVKERSSRFSSCGISEKKKNKRLFWVFSLLYGVN